MAPLVCTQDTHGMEPAATQMGGTPVATQIDGTPAVTQMGGSQLPCHSTGPFGPGTLEESAKGPTEQECAREFQKRSEESAKSDFRTLLGPVDSLETPGALEGFCGSQTWRPQETFFALFWMGSKNTIKHMALDSPPPQLGGYGLSRYGLQGRQQVYFRPSCHYIFRLRITKAIWIVMLH